MYSTKTLKVVSTSFLSRPMSTFSSFVIQKQGLCTRNSMQVGLNLKFRAFDLVYPSRNTSYDTDISYLKDFADVDTFVDNFKNLDPEAILNKHISSRMNSEWNQSGLSMGRIFAFKIYLASNNVNYRTK